MSLLIGELDFGRELSSTRDIEGIEDTGVKLLDFRGIIGSPTSTDSDFLGKVTLLTKSVKFGRSECLGILARLLKTTLGIGASETEVEFGTKETKLSTIRSNGFGGDDSCGGDGLNDREEIFND